MIRKMTFALAATLLLTGAGGLRAQPCADDMAFGPWLDGVRAEAASLGISPSTVAVALDGATFDQSIVARDRRQSVFSQTFLEFAGRMVNQNRLDHGAANLRKHAATFDRLVRPEKMVGNSFFRHPREGGDPSPEPTA